MARKTKRQRAEDNFRNIEFVGTEGRLGEFPQSRKAKKLARGQEGFASISFPGTEGMLGPPPKRGKRIG